MKKSPSSSSKREKTAKKPEVGSVWAHCKRILAVLGLFAILLNGWAVKRLRAQFRHDRAADFALYEAPLDDGLDVTDAAADESSGPVRTFQAKPRPPNKILKILQLLEKTEKGMFPPADMKKRVVVLGKSFIMKRDFDIWEITFSERNYQVASTTKQQMQHEKDEAWIAMLCLDLFDGKTHCIEPSELPAMKPWQRISRLYGLRKILWNKDKFCETMSSALKGFAYNFTEFVFPCWVLPHDYNDMIELGKTKYKNKQFILKPTDRGEGNGIIVMDSYRKLPNWKAEFPDNDEVVVQTYLPNPFLINGRKWDMRTYILVTSIHPLRVYMFRDGLVRFASSRYDADAKDGGKKTAFLTNTSVNKKTGAAVDDLTWPFPQVWGYLNRIGVDPAMLWTEIERSVVQVLLAAEPAFLRRFKSLRNDYICSNCYQLLGVDVIVDDDLIPRVIEVNGEPSMQLTGERGSHYDSTKKSMAHDVAQVMFTTDSYARSLVSDLYELEIDGFRIGYQALGGCTSDDDICLRSIDLQYLLAMKREEQVMGGFRRIYPSKNGEYYSKFIEHLERKLPYGTLTSTHRIHKLTTKLQQISRVKTDNEIADPNYKGESHRAEAEEVD